MSSLHQYYTLFLSSLDEFEPRDNFLNQSRKPKLSDKALIALNLAAEATSIDSQLNPFRQLPPEVKGKIERFCIQQLSIYWLFALRGGVLMYYYQRLHH